MRFISKLVFLVCLSLNSAFAEDIKIAVVDLQRALQSVDTGKKAKATLEKEFNDKKKKLQTEEESLKKMAEDFKKQSLVLSDEAKMKKNQEFQERAGRYSEMVRTSQLDIQNRERELTEPIITRLRGIVEDLGSKRSYTIILEKNENNVLFSQKKDDLTEEVIQLFNKKNG